MTLFRHSLTALALCAIGIMTADAQAQIFTGLMSAPPMVMPGAVRTPAPVRDQTSPVPAPAPAQVLHHMPHTLEGFLLTGETGTLEWPVYLTRAQAGGALRFRLGYLSAVSVLEEASTITFKINGQAVGTVSINAPQAIKTVEFPIPAGFAAPGANALSITVEQRHRVDCSVAATYELWTKIDPLRTGLLLDPMSEPNHDLADLPALLPYADGSLPIRIVLAVKTTPAQIERYIKVTQQIAIAGHFLQPSVDFGPFAEDANGINLVVGTRETLRRLPRIGAAAGVSGPNVSLVTLDGMARPTLVISGSDDAEVERAIAMLETLKPFDGTPSGRDAVTTYPGLKTSGNRRMPLKDFGVRSREFAGHLYRQSFNFVLPADFLSADYARGTFDLAGGYAPGLSREAQVRVDINGRNAGQLRLPNQAGDVFRHNPMFLPLGLMRPGLNRIDIVAETPKPEDASCDTSRPLSTDKRLLVLDTSELTLPILARVQRLPDLALTTSGGLPFTSGHPKLFVPQPDKDTMAAALSLVARAGVAAGRVIPFEFTLKPPTDETGSTLVVAAARALDPALMTETGLDPASVEAAWHDQAAPAAKATPLSIPSWWTANSDGPAACRLPRLATGVTRHDPADSVTELAAMPGPDENDGLFDRWTTNVHAAPAWRDAMGRLSRHVSSVVGRFGERLAWPRLAKPSGTGIGPAATLIMAQGMRAGSSKNVTTIVTAPDAATLKASVACLGDPQIWTQVRGRLSVLDAADGTLTNTEAEQVHYAMSGPVSIGNTRLVVAGWFSLNPTIFVLIALAAAACLSGTTVMLLRGIGRNPSK